MACRKWVGRIGFAIRAQGLCVTIAKPSFHISARRPGRDIRNEFRDMAETPQAQPAAIPGIGTA